MPTPRRPPPPLCAYVLHHYDWSESSLILDLFSREQGRLVVVAKGAKRPHSQLRPVLLPFQRLQIALTRGSAPGDRPDDGASEVQTLRTAERAGGGTLPAGAGLFSGFYLNELLMKLLARHDPHPGLFDAYDQTLPALADEADGQAALRAFELRLLLDIGLLPELNVVTATQAAVVPDRHYRLLPEGGVVAARGREDLPGAALIAVQAALQHGSLAALRQACQGALPAWRSGLRSLLHYHLGTPMLRTRQLMVELQSLQVPPR
jgi:DNA repair protein RecO (recombination protein O)